MDRVRILNSLNETLHWKYLTESKNTNSVSDTIRRQANNVTVQNTNNEAKNGNTQKNSDCVT